MNLILNTKKAEYKYIRNNQTLNAKNAELHSVTYIDKDNGFMN